MKFTRNQAKQQGLKYYFPNKPCKYGHVAHRRVSNYTCVVCESQHSSNFQRNSEHVKQYRHEWWKTYYQRNKHEVARRSVSCQRSREAATPSWYTNETYRIRNLYKQAQELTETTGIQHHVDHIVPITHDKVCGLHCFSNLQVLRYDENIRKSNTFDVS